MRPAVALVVVLATTVALWTAPGFAAPRYDEDSKTLADRDLQVLRDMIMQMMQQMLRANDFGPICHHKRNSEIINSLLGLPKTMTDAGRK